MKKHTLNGLISLLISVVATVAMADSDDEGHSMQEMLLAVAVSAFLSGFFTSYFAGESDGQSVDASSPTGD